jgi:uncharacterized protein YjiS (DUF1127 family)
VRDRIPLERSKRGLRFLLRGWAENHTARRRLLRCQRIDPRFAKDIGLTHGDIVLEAHAPFWRKVCASRA